eukprot:COSAG04_NODE_21576_length_371_cov_0.757353_1_plen_31_part_10
MQGGLRTLAGKQRPNPYGKVQLEASLPNRLG